jgi:hypothetical protein
LRHPHNYDPNQPRVPEGHRGGGRWTRGDYGERAKMQLAFANSPSPRVRGVLGLALFAIYAAVSRLNGLTQRAIIIVKARGSRLEDVRVIEEDEVGKVCKRLENIQDFTDEAVEKLGPERRTMDDNVFGTKVHSYVRDKIREKKPPNLFAEQSFVELGENATKAKREEDIKYGTAGSIRIDAYERLGRHTICIYDIKVGNSGLTPKRMIELFRRLKEKYPEVTRFIVTEVRPTSMKRDMRGRTLGR